MSELLNNLDKIPNPSFVLDEELLVKNLEQLSFVEKASGAKVLCALKGFAMWSTFPLVKKYITGGTASSLNEVRLIKEEMGLKAHACFVTYISEEFMEVQEMSSHVTFNSLNQFERFKALLKKDVKYALRVNPEFSSVPFEQYNPCMPGSRFGIVKDLLPNELPKEISGLHFHALCESGAEDLEALIAHVEANFGHLLHQVEWVNFGGGHHITKPGYDIELLIQLISNLKANYNVEVFLEPGEAIGLNTGYLLAKVEDVVENNGESTAILNVSFSAHMPDCLEMPYKPGLVAEPNEGVDITLGGNSCMSGDFVRGFKFEKAPQVGDVLVFEDMMHYTFVKTTSFNGVKHPDLCIWKRGGGVQVLREFDYNFFKFKLS